jgi:hypothetical protein
MGFPDRNSFLYNENVSNSEQDQENEIREYILKTAPNATKEEKEDMRHLWKFIHEYISSHKKEIEEDTKARGYSEEQVKRAIAKVEERCGPRIIERYKQILAEQKHNSQIASNQISQNFSCKK